MSEWESIKAAALKILGDNGDVPDMPPNIDLADNDIKMAGRGFDQSRQDLEAKLLDLQNAFDLLTNALKQFSAKIEKSDFGLDAKNKDDQKKIAKARQMLTGWLNDIMKICTDYTKVLDELDKHVVQLEKYKPKSVL